MIRSSSLAALIFVLSISLTLIAAAAAERSAPAAPHAAAAVKQVIRTHYAASNSTGDGRAAGDSIGLFDRVMSFVSAIAWGQEPWLWALGVFYISLGAVIYHTRGQWQPQLFILAAACKCVG